MSGYSSDATPTTLRRKVQQTGLRLLIWLVVIGLLVVPLLKDFPLGDTSRAGILALILVGIAIYWLFTDMGYRPLLLFQVFLFSAAVACLSAKVLLVSVGVNRLTILRRLAIWMILLGALCAGGNVAITFIDLLRHGGRSPETPAV